ncbi:MAG: transglycosylase SLT domain-containing protein [Rhodocyclaceae bacterium]|nr:transglycosylase SLT domain-containing protein [Rhodocyclaceae bacterium]
MRRWLCARILLPLLALAWFSPQGFAAPGDAQVLAAREAFRKGDEKSLLALRESVKGHELEPYVEYWGLRLRLDQISAADILAFKERWPDSLAAERLRLDWVKQLGKRKDWDGVAREYAALEQPDAEATCISLQGRLAKGDDAVADEALRLWLAGGELPETCRPVMDALVLSHRLGSDEVWVRIRRVMESRKVDPAREAANYLNDAPGDKALGEVAESPERFLGHLKPTFATRRSGRELAMIAVARWAHSDPQKAALRWESLRDRFSPAERGYVYGQLAWQGALHHLPEAVAWYKAAEESPLTDEQRAWKARAGLRAGDWKLVRATVEAMPLEQASRPEWVYWLGRADKAQGKKLEAEKQFGKLAGQPNFYGNLSDEELGHLIDVPAAIYPNDAEIAAAADQPGIRRALAFYRLDQRTEGAREWSWALRRAGDRFLLAAAAVAKREGLFDRAISAADRTKGEHDFGMRYLAPYRDRVEPAAKDLRLDESWIYGLMRQESRFVTAARSGVGARGLMQVMPSTAKWVAKKLGMKKFRTDDMGNMDTNVLLGTNYMKMVLASLDNHPVLASAAYNAGPGRARQWRDDRPLEGAIYVETIPFAETRDYVKKVMSNAVYYAALFEKKPQSLKARLGTISPRGGPQVGDPDMP